VKFEVSRRARRQIEALNAWWVEHRSAARSLFLDELERVERLLRDNPEIGAVYAAHKHGAIRHVLLSRTDHRLYYRYRREHDEIVVMMVWGPSRARGPRF
jgi:plasmid stabilization system protein ParE